MFDFIKNSSHLVAFLLTFILTLILGPVLIPALRRLKFGQTIRDDGPSSHLIKKGTPTMGGVIFLIPAMVVAAYYSIQDYRVLPLLLATAGFGIIGFLDDYIKVVKKSKDGLYPKQKMFWLILVSVVFSVYAVNYGGLGLDLYIPLFNINYTFSSPWIYAMFITFILISITNAVNLTDGLDGLAGGVTFIIMIFFTIVAMTDRQWDFIKIFSAIMAGGCLGFLAFNIHPAKVFMGDTGSLALGGAVGAAAVMLKMPFIILLVGLIYVLEALSVIIQVASFKLRGKRVFKMAPLHHHFELSGWKETKVVYFFWFMTLVLCIIGLFSL